LQREKAAILSRFPRKHSGIDTGAINMKKQYDKPIEELSRFFEEPEKKRFQKFFLSIIKNLEDGECRANAERDQYKALLTLIVQRLKEAKDAYHKPGDRQDKRAREALRILGFTKEGKRQATYNKKALMHEYLALITGAPDLNDVSTWATPPKPLDKKSATDLLANRYGREYYAAIYQHLNDYRIEQKNNHADEPHGWIFNKIMPPKPRKQRPGRHVR
jgi:hypothetical protein